MGQACEVATCRACEAGGGRLAWQQRPQVGGLQVRHVQVAKQRRQRGALRRQGNHFSDGLVLTGGSRCVANGSPTQGVITHQRLSTQAVTSKLHLNC